MPRFIVVGMFVASMWGTAAAQVADDTASANERIIVLYKQGKFDEAIPIAERVTAAEKKRGKMSDTYLMALTNLGMLHKEKAKALKKEIMNLELKKRRSVYAEAERSANEAKDAFHKVHEAYFETKRAESNESAAVKSELAWLTYNFIDSRTTAATRTQIDEAEKLFSDSISIREKLGNGDADLTLKTILEFGDFYMRYVNFEKALRHYETYLARTEKRYGDKSKSLVPALRALKEIYFVTFRETDAKAIADRISSISGSPETVTQSFPLLALRSRKLANIKGQRFVPIDFRDDPQSLFNAALGVGSISVPGRIEFKRLVVDITVDEEGNVIEARARTQSKFEKEAEAAALESKFRPFSYQGKAEKMRGSIDFRYFDR